METLVSNMSYEEYLEHYGVKGMRWGSRSGRPSGTPRKTERMAAKDAKESAQAKMYYGEGAGIRRRQINNTVKSRSKDPAYKEAFNRNLERQDLAKASSKAHSKRKRTDVVKGTAKTSRGIINILNGNAGAASATAVGLVGLAAGAHKLGVDKMLMDKGKTFLQSQEFKRNSQRIADEVLRNMRQG